SVAAAVISAGCSGTIAARRPLSNAAVGEVNEIGEGHSAIVLLKPGDDAKSESRRALDVTLTRDVTVLLEESPLGAEPHHRSVPTAALQQIKSRHRAGPAIAGSLLGFVVGAAAGIGLDRILLNA